MHRLVYTRISLLCQFSVPSSNEMPVARSTLRPHILASKSFSSKRNRGLLEKWLIPGLQQDDPECLVVLEGEKVLKQEHTRSDVGISKRQRSPGPGSLPEDSECFFVASVTPRLACQLSYQPIFLLSLPCRCRAAKGFLHSIFCAFFMGVIFLVVLSSLHCGNVFIFLTKETRFPFFQRQC